MWIGAHPSYEPLSGNPIFRRLESIDSLGIAMVADLHCLPLGWGVTNWAPICVSLRQVRTVKPKR